MTIYALPGFLGLQSDWAGLEKEFSTYKVISIDPYQIAKPEQSLDKWAQKFIETIEPSKQKPIFVGYSMGARLGMHALLENSRLFKALVLISGNLGLKTKQEKKKRLVSDHIWAERFQKEPWESLMHSWNSQPLFSATTMPRYEKDHCRKQLSSTLIHWSLANQRDFFPIIKQASLPVLWVVGELDKTYSHIAKTMKFSHPLSEVRIIPSSFHRVPWEQSQEFYAVLAQFLHRLEA
ncbi:MAG: alpha/beta fold hydrolase [Candidatus Rhabdochlamydia sp.]